MVLSRMVVAVLMILLLLAIGSATVLRGEAPGDDRARCDQLFQQGNWKEAYDGYRRLSLDPKTEADRVGGDLTRAIDCLEKLGRVDEIDAFRDAVVAVHEKNWRLLQVAAATLIDHNHFGVIVAGVFHRGGYREGGRWADASERDRALAIQLLFRGLDRARTDPDRPAAGRYLMQLARALLDLRDGTAAWQLQVLTPLDTLPDYAENWVYPHLRQAGGAPVGPDGSPVYYRVPESIEKARSDGERWRWALAQAAEADPGMFNAARLALAQFLVGRFGTQTIAGEGLPGFTDSDAPPTADNPYALHTLADDETIARLATGVRRFKLPEEFQFIRILRAIADDPKTGHGEEALQVLASVYSNRRQFDRLAEVLRRSLATYGDHEGQKAQQIEQVVGAWGRFEATTTQPAGRGASVGFAFRNGRRVHFEARPIFHERLLDDVKRYLSSPPPGNFDWQRANIEDIGARLVADDGAKYLGPIIAAWDLDLDPPPRHFTRRIDVTTPLQRAGAYLLTARMAGGNNSRIIVWLDDTAIVEKVTAGGVYEFIADARTGHPVPGAQVELFGWRWLRVDGRNEFRTDVRTLTLNTDRDGQAQVRLPTGPPGQPDYQWIVSARTRDGRLAFRGFPQVWFPGGGEENHRRPSAFAITDRPVYRPGGPVKFKVWVARSEYNQPDASAFAGRAFGLEIHDPQGNKVYENRFQADAFGGFDGSFELPSDAPLGTYQLIAPEIAHCGSFRVEEYKKPEFEVKVEAPEAPARLGESIAATIKASYYFGGPVSEAKVHYKVTRTTADARWYPSDRWDWLFGPGYWWFAPDFAWYPGWSRWGVPRPIAAWWGRPQGPPEIVAEADVPIRPDGTIPITIDTATALAAHPDSDHRYAITAEVTDRSRRTIVGNGEVLVARRPFAVYTWVDRGYYRAGDTIEASLRAQTLDRKPVAGKGTLRLLKVAYDAQGRPSETPVETWEIALDADGQAHQKIKAATPGQYRLSATIDDGRGHSEEGGYLLTVTGLGFNGSGFRFGDIEVIPERKEYKPGETLRLQVNTNRVDATVLLFVRPVNSVYLPPKIVRLRGKSTVEEIGIVPGDMPNIFVEALTIADGKVHDETREIAVPPSSRVVDVAIEPIKTTYRPGAKAAVKLKLTGPDGRPFSGSTVLAVYDKAVEYISGGGNVPDLKAFYWSWKRSHYPRTFSSLDRHFANFGWPLDKAMNDLGAFGWIVAVDAMSDGVPQVYGNTRRRGLAGGMGGMGRMMAAAPVAGPMAKAKEADRKSDIEEDKARADTTAPVEPVVRTNFADTAYWAAAITAGPDGTAEVTFPMPESLTTWKVRGWTMGPGTRVGQASAEIVTTKDLLVRPQAPRFFVERDEVTLSAIVHNKLATKKAVQVLLECDGGVLAPMEATARNIDIDAGAEQRVDWRVKVAHAGEAVIRMKAITDEESDAAQLKFPAYIHGALRTESFAGTIRPDGESSTIALRVPAERKPEQSRLEVRYSPTLAGALVDALPYLADYPYGCTEQTLNRFLPTVLTQKVLIGLGVDLKAIRAKHTNLNAQELGDARDRAKRWKGYEHNPVFDADEVARMARAGLKRLADMQLSDGGWGWFSGSGEYASAHTTALVVHGLQVARRNDLAIPGDMDKRGVAWLSAYQAEQVRLLERAVSTTEKSKSQADDNDALVVMILADAGTRNDRMLAYLDRDRTRLSVYGLTLYGLALERLGDKEKLAMVMRNIGQYVVRDDENQTAYLKLPNQGYWWWWYGSELETHAFYLELLSRTEPRGELAPRLVKYLLNNRRHGTYWDSTRDTAFIVEAMADYLRASGEDRPEMTVAIAIDGRSRKEVTITPADLFSFDNGFALEGADLTTGDHTLTISRKGKGPVYFNAYLTNFTMEDPIRSAGLEIKVDRKVYRLLREDRSVDVSGGRGQAVGQRVERYRREPMPDGSTFKSGDLVEVELEIESKNDYEYLVFEDFKAAGFEPVEVRSGYNGNDLGAYVEFRDERVAFFARSLSRGKHSVAYRLRAEIPGRFHALPARAQAMYAPELRGNSEEIRLGIED